MGCGEYDPIARDFRVPIVITGFEPLDLLEGILWTLRQLESGRAASKIPTPGPCGPRATLPRGD